MSDPIESAITAEHSRQEASTELAESIRDILGRYRVQSHYRATRDANATRYAVFTGSSAEGTTKQVTEPSARSEAVKAAQDLTIIDLLEFFRGEFSDAKHQALDIASRA